MARRIVHSFSSFFPAAAAASCLALTACSSDGDNVVYIRNSSGQLVAVKPSQPTQGQIAQRKREKAQELLSRIRTDRDYVNHLTTEEKKLLLEMQVITMDDDDRD